MPKSLLYGSNTITIPFTIRPEPGQQAPNQGQDRSRRKFLEQAPDPADEMGDEEEGSGATPPQSRSLG